MLNPSATKMGLLEPHGKNLVAHAMFRKGKQFLAAAVLLHQKASYGNVVLHLLCQGLEIVQKGLLLARNYDKFKSQLTDKRMLGHDLVRGSLALQIEYALKPLKRETEVQLQLLNRYYCRHLLRYGNIRDILCSTKKLQFEAVMRRSVALTKLGNKVFR
jgi:hypothetical protein